MRSTIQIPGKSFVNSKPIDFFGTSSTYSTNLHMETTILLALVALIGSIVSGMSGVGGGVLLLAFMTPIFTPHVLIPLHGLIMMCSNLARVSISYKAINMKIIIPFTIGALIGALAGIPVTLRLPKDTFRIILAVAILIMTWFPKIKKDIQFPGQFAIIGACASFLSLFIGATGPFTAPFFLRAQLGKEGFVATRTASNIPVHLFKLGVFTLSGFVVFQWWKELAVTIPMVFIGNWIGKQLLGKIPEYYFTQVIKIVISALVLRMIMKSLNLI